MTNAESSAVAKPAMIFHVPYALNPNATSASGIRPVKMRAAFEQLGFEVYEVSGSATERRSQMTVLKQAIDNGLDIEFVYSESSTRPNTFSESFRSPHPFLDNGFLRFCRRHGIPVGLFYRDIYWRFADYRTMIGFAPATVLRACYLWDLLTYRRSITRLYLPSERMAAHVPIVEKSTMRPLLPAFDLPAITARPHKSNSSRLTLFYVGAVGEFYRLHKIVESVGQVSGVDLTLCVPEAQWASVSSQYERMLSPSVHVVQATGTEVTAKLQSADIGVLFVEPINQWAFASPVNMFEYLANGKPIIAVAGTSSADFIESSGIGWTIPYDTDALTALLTHLAAHPAEVKAKAETAERVRTEHTWIARAQAVATDLRGDA